MEDPTITDVIVGAGPVGSALARRLQSEGRRVRVLTRSGIGPASLDVEYRSVDASNAEALTAATLGAEVLYNCANPGAYPLWEKEWPPLAAAILTAAERTGAVLVTTSNLYSHGPVTEPMTRHTALHPSDHKGALRARMWEDAVSAHATRGVRVTEARSSDYIGATVPISNGLLPRYADAVLSGKTATVFADPDQLHSWTAIDDVAATLAALGRNDRAWGSAWIVPSNPPVTVRDVLRALSALAGLGEPRLRRVPRWTLRVGGTVVPLLREVTGILYQFDAPFIVNATETTEIFGVAPTPWQPLLQVTADAWAQRARSRSI
jgi:nucleoside-diphosphate-sugar epimerase